MSALLNQLKERFIAIAQPIADRIQESSAYHQLHDRFENLTPWQQRLVIITSSAFAVLLILYFPFSLLSTSSDSIAEFETRRDLIRQLNQVTREAAEFPNLPAEVSISQATSIIENQLKAAQLLPTQIKGLTATNTSSKLVPQNLTVGGLQVSLSKLNLRQIISISTQIQNISPHIKVKDLSIEANREDSRYLDMVLTLVSLKVPEVPMPTVAAEPPPPPGRPKPKGPNRGDE